MNLKGDHQTRHAALWLIEKIGVKPPANYSLQDLDEIVRIIRKIVFDCEAPKCPRCDAESLPAVRWQCEKCGYEQITQRK